MSKWVTNDAIRGVQMVLQLKQAAIDGGLQNPVSEITGCGTAVVTRFLDALINDWMKQTSDAHDHEFNMDMYRSMYKSYHDELGIVSVDEMYDEEREDYKRIAQKWEKARKKWGKLCDEAEDVNVPDLVEESEDGNAAKR